MPFNQLDQRDLCVVTFWRRFQVSTNHSSASCSPRSELICPLSLQIGYKHSREERSKQYHCGSDVTMTTFSKVLFLSFLLAVTAANGKVIACCLSFASDHVVFQLLLLHRQRRPDVQPRSANRQPTTSATRSITRQSHATIFGSMPAEAGWPITRLSLRKRKHRPAPWWRTR